MSEDEEKNERDKKSLENTEDGTTQNYMRRHEYMHCAMSHMVNMECLDILQYYTSISNRIYRYRAMIILLVLYKCDKLSYDGFVDALPSYFDPDFVKYGVNSSTHARAYAHA